MRMYFMKNKKKLGTLVGAVSAIDEEMIIKDGVPAAALISPDEFERWRENMAIRFDTVTSMPLLQ